MKHEVTFKLILMQSQNFLNFFQISQVWRQISIANLNQLFPTPCNTHFENFDKLQPKLFVKSYKIHRQTKLDQLYGQWLADWPSKLVLVIQAERCLKPINGADTVALCNQQSSYVKVIRGFIAVQRQCIGVLERCTAKHRLWVWSHQCYTATLIRTHRQTCGIEQLNNKQAGWDRLLVDTGTFPIFTKQTYKISCTTVHNFRPKVRTEEWCTSF